MWRSKSQSISFDDLFVLLNLSNVLFELLFLLHVEKKTYRVKGDGGVG